MSKIVSFQFNSDSEIRVIDNQWFVAADVCQGREIADAAQAVRQIKNQLNHADIKGEFSKRIPIATNGGIQNTVCVNEAGLNLLIMQSRKKEAIKFKWWVASEVLPAIRKTGNYSLTLNTEQQHLVKAAVLANVARTGKTYQSVYRELYNKFKVPKCQDILAKDFDKAMKFLAATTQNKIYILDIPFDLRRDCDYYVRVRDGKVRRASIAYAMLSEDQGKPWQAL